MVTVTLRIFREIIHEDNEKGTALSLEKLARYTENNPGSN